MSTFRIFLLSIFLVAFGQNGRSAIAYPSVPVETGAQVVFSKNKKEKKRARFWKKLKAKFAKAKPDKERRKNHYGRLGLLILLAGVVLTILSGAFFALALLGAVVFGIIGIIEDEKKTAAIISFVLPVAFVLTVLVSVALVIGG